MPEIETHAQLPERSAPPVFGRSSFRYFEIDEVRDGAAFVDGKPVGTLEQRLLGSGVVRVRFVVRGSGARPLDDLIPLPEKRELAGDLRGVPGISRYEKSPSVQRNTALALGFARGPDGDVVCFDSFQLDGEEELYGLGERHLSLRVRGSRERLWIGEPYVNTTSTPVYLSVPLIVSTAGWGVAVLHGGGVIVEAGNPTANALTIAVEDDALDYLLFSADDLAGVVRLVADTFGRPKMPPDWSLGVWMSRLMYFSRAEVETMIDSLTADGFPVDVICLDPYWHKSGFTDPSGADRSTLVWNDDDFGPLEDFFGEMARREVRVSLWESPYLSTHNFAFPEAKEAEILLEGPNGDPVSPADFLWRAGIVDFTKPAAIEWWKERHRPLVRAGAAIFKCDFGESVPADARFSDGRTGGDLHNLYPLLYHRATAEVCREVRGDDFVIWARSGFFGSATDDVPWVGDSVSSWDGMACALRAVLSLSMSGYPFVSVDIGGFILWDEPIGMPPADLFARWSQWGLLLSHSRFHGVGGREPILCPEPERSIVREMCLLRKKWFPYLSKLCAEATENGSPVARPLVFTWPDDPSARQDELTYTLGPSVLVAPVFRADGRRTHYLPPGVWLDHFTGERSEGERWRTDIWPLDRFPLYIREGAEIP